MDLKEAIQQIAKDDQQEIYSLVCTVDEVNEDERTCKVTPVNGGVAVFGVRLQAIKDNNQGLVVIPSVNSQVVVTFLNKQTGYVALHTDVDKIFSDSPLFEFNGGDNGGLVNIEDLVSAINSLQDAHNDFVTTFNTHTHNAPQAPSGTIPTTPPLVPSTDQSVPPVQVSDMEDDTVKH